MYDAIVVGARCAGSPTAMLLAKQGYKVLLVDRARFPSDMMSTHFIHLAGIAKLKEWGLLDRVRATNCPPVSRFEFELGPFKLGHFLLKGSPLPKGDVAASYGPRRYLLDKILLDAAVEAGVEVREKFCVDELLTDGERVTGIRGRGEGNLKVTEAARIVIGADGINSRVARAVQAAQYDEKPATACYFYSYWSGMPNTALRSHLVDRRFILFVPTNDGLVNIAVGRPISEYRTYRADIEGEYMKVLDKVPEVNDLVRSGRREERFTGTAHAPNYLRKPYGAGWALVGDAGMHMDPYLGQGITNAFTHAGMLAEAIDAGFSGRQLLEEALAEYEQRRNAAVRPIYEMNANMATLEPPPDQMVPLLAALSMNEVERRRFFGMIAGSVPVPQFMAEENIRRIIEETLGAPPEVPALLPEEALA